ncbi:MAG TPA: hypothetical protein H9915_08730 [Candidatus Gemmiger faecigallinarum]|nr:hypothetical protein [Candidatus Gemmiger faecigallinarum]
MAWVTKSSTEEYNTEPTPPREYTRREKADNWWYYHKWFVIAGVLLAAAAAWILYDIFGRPVADYHIGWVGMGDLPADTVSALEQQLTAYGADLNGDGQVLVELEQFSYDFNPPADDETDPTYRMAMLTRLEGDLALEDGCYIFLLQDPEGFQRQTGALQYLDGTLPADGAEDWQNMVYRWGDCPVLAGLELGDYTGLTSVDDITGSSQELLADVYVARRGNWQEDNSYYAAGDAMWDALTAGAVPLSGE